jgi:hypothetical protein
VGVASSHAGVDSCSVEDAPVLAGSRRRPPQLCRWMRGPVAGTGGKRPATAGGIDGGVAQP